MYNERTKGGLNPRGQQPQSNLQVSTIRSFEGGLNTADTDLNMSPQYGRVLDNIERGLDGTLSIRSGTRFFAKLTDHPGHIVNIFYFQDHVITVQEDGTISKVAGDGTVTTIGAPYSGLWGASVTYASFTIFNGDLIICNGVDKPLIISGDPANANYMVPVFLEDLGSGTNVNTPIGKYVIAHGQYTIIAGIPSAPSTIEISSKGTSGTYLSDPPPNDAISLDLGPRVSIGDRTITGMVAYRDKLLVTFERGVLPLNLGVYTGTPAVHTPTDDGFIEEFGCIAHRTLSSVGDDTFYLDNVGVNSMARISVFNTLRPVRVSHLIDPLIYNQIKTLTQTLIDKYIFAIYDLRHFRYIVFVPKLSDDSLDVIETTAYSYTNIPTMKIQAWARLRGWVWTCACRTALENIVFGDIGTNLYTYDFDNETGCGDYAADPSDPDHPNGYPVLFNWELPWADFKNRMDIKQIRYIGVDTEGTGQFTVQAFVDNISPTPEAYYGAGGDTADPNALLSMQMIAGDAGGYGASLYGDDPYGGGRRASDERLMAWPAKFKLLKLRFIGSTIKRIKFISVSLAYLHGSIRR
jgi:hypothetical protein